MTHNVKQIYHVARGGSTLMTSLLSAVATCYLEPPNGIDIANSGDVPEYLKDTVVKFQSLALMKPILLTGKKVFLYRPLAQHLQKITSVESYWIHYRAEYLRSILVKNEIWNPDTDVEMIAHQWICAASEMLRHDNVLWIESNDLFRDKKIVMDKVCDHFKLPYITDFSLAKVNVKRLMLNGKADRCTIDDKITKELVDDTHGIIENNDVSAEIYDVVDVARKIYPHISYLM